MSELNRMQQHQAQRIRWHLMVASRLAEQMMEGLGARWVDMATLQDVDAGPDEQVDVPAPEVQAHAAVMDAYVGMTAAGVCPSTEGWVWYCDAHQIHGNAGTSDEAQFMADMHESYFVDDEDDCSTFVAHAHPGSVESES